MSAGRVVPESNWISIGTPARNATLTAAALKIAAAHYTFDEFRDLERDLEAGTVEIRLYEDGLVLMRVGGSVSGDGSGYGGE